MAVELELVVAADASLGGVSGAVTLEMATGIPGPNTVTTSTTTDLTGLLAGDGSTVGRVSLDSPLTVSIPGAVAAGTIYLIGYAAFPFTLVEMRSYQTDAGLVNLAIKKNGTTLTDPDADEGVGATVTIDTAFAVGDVLSVALNPNEGTTGLRFTLILRRTVE